MFCAEGKLGKMSILREVGMGLLAHLKRNSARHRAPAAREHSLNFKQRAVPRWEGGDGSGKEGTSPTRLHVMAVDGSMMGLGVGLGLGLGSSLGLSGAGQYWCLGHRRGCVVAGDAVYARMCVWV